LLGIKTPGIDVLSAAGLFYARIGNVAQAVALGEQIRDKSPRHASGKFLEGEMHYSEGNFEDARNKYAESARLEPRAQFLDGVGRASEKLGMFDEAVTNYGKALEADARYLSPRLGRARIQLVRGKYKAALAELDTAKQIAPTDPNIHAGLGESHLAMRKYKEAVAAFELAVKLNDTNAEWFFMLGNAYFDLDQPRPAVVAFRKALEIGDGDESWRDKALDRLGRAARMTNQKGIAIKAYKELLERVPKDGLMHREASKELMRLQAQ
jgi:tetratricopeptide (TPR) repeat protein